MLVTEVGVVEERVRAPSRLRVLEVLLQEKLGLSVMVFCEPIKRTEPGVNPVSTAGPLKVEVLVMVRLEMVLVAKFEVPLTVRLPPMYWLAVVVAFVAVRLVTN